MTDSITRFHNWLQGMLRSAPGVQYQLPFENNKFRCCVLAGSASFVGSSPWSYEIAKQDAAERALHGCQVCQTEEGLRLALELPPRYHISQCDGIRDQLRVLKQRAKALSFGRAECLKGICLFYGKLDEFEAKLMFYMRD